MNLKNQIVEGIELNYGTAEDLLRHLNARYEWFCGAKHNDLHGFRILFSEGQLFINSHELWLNDGKIMAARLAMIRDAARRADYKVYAEVAAELHTIFGEPGAVAAVAAWKYYRHPAAAVPLERAKVISEVSDMMAGINRADLLQQAKEAVYNLLVEDERLEKAEKEGAESV